MVLYTSQPRIEIGNQEPCNQWWLQLRLKRDTYVADGGQARVKGQMETVALRQYEAGLVDLKSFSKDFVGGVVKKPIQQCIVQMVLVARIRNALIWGHGY